MLLDNDKREREYYKNRSITSTVQTIPYGRGNEYEGHSMHSWNYLARQEKHEKKKREETEKYVRVIAEGVADLNKKRAEKKMNELEEGSSNSNTSASGA